MRPITRHELWSFVVRLVKGLLDLLRRRDMSCGCPPYAGNCDCGITDTFTRTVSSPGLGTADSLDTYAVATAATATISANGSKGIITLDTAGGVPVNASGTLSVSPRPWDIDARHSITFALNNFGDGAISAAEKIEIRFQPFGGASNPARVVILPDASSLWSAGSQITWTGDLVSGTAIPLGFWVADTVYTFTVRQQGTSLIAEVTDGSSTYAVSQSLTPLYVQSIVVVALRDVVAPFTTSVVTTVTLDDLDVPEVRRCSKVSYDDFRRSESNTWGTAQPSGDTWDKTGGSATLDVSNGVGLVSGSSRANAFIDTGSSTGPWTLGAFTLLFDFSTDAFDTSTSPVAVDWVDFDGKAELFIAMATTGEGTVSIFSATNGETAKNDWAINTTYRCRWEYVPDGTTRARVWPLTAAEPTTWTAEAEAAGTMSSVLTLTTRSADVATVQRISAIDFQYPDQPCYPGSDLALIRPKPYQPIEDELLGYGDGSRTEFRTDWPYLALEVEVAGVGVEYVPTNALERVVTLLSAPSLGQEVRGTYLRA